MKRTFSHVALLLSVVAAAAGLAAAAPAAQVRVRVVPHVDLAAAASRGAVGLLVPGWGDTVSRESALAALRSGRVHNPHVPAPSPPLIDLDAGTGGPGTLILVELPAPGVHENDRRYPIAILGSSHRGLLTSPSTRIPGLVSIADVAPTVLSVESRPIPDGVTGHALSSSPADDPLERLERLDRRLAGTRAARLPAALGYVLLAAGLAVAALLARSSLLARGALLALPAAASVSIALSLAGVTSWATFIGATAAGALAGAALLRTRIALALALVAVLAFHLAALGLEPKAVALSLLGPNPDAGGRFYGLPNELETILLVPALLAGALLWERLGLFGLAGPAALAIVMLGAGRLGASVTGAIVAALGFAVLAIDLGRRRGAVLVVCIAAGAALVLALAPPAHLSGAGPARLVERLELSGRLAVDGPEAIVVVFALGLAPLAGFALFYTRMRARLDPAPGAVLLALLVALAVSTLVNDSPGAVLGHGVLGYLAALTWALVCSDDDRSEGLYRLAPRCAGSPFSLSWPSRSSSAPAAAGRTRPPRPRR